MAWLWWLLAPVVSTIVGALFLAAKARHESRFDGDRSDPMIQHQRLLQTLADSARPSDLPSTMIVLDADPVSLPIRH